MKTASNRKRVLDLDDRRISLEKLDVYAPDFGRKTPRTMAVLFLQLVLRQALTDRAVAVNLFHDAEDDCLRGLEYFPEKDTGAETSYQYREFHPAPACFSEQVLGELRRRIGVDCAPGEGTLHYRYEGKVMPALAVVSDSSEVRVYFTGHRPTMRKK